MENTQPAASNIGKIVEIRSLYYTYPPPREVEALTDINLEIRKGEFLAVIGPNGSGKTTLTKCMAGLLRPSRGSVLIKGKPVADYKLRERSRLIGYIFQNPDHQLLKDTVHEDVAFGLKNLGETEDQIRTKVQRVLLGLGIWEKSDLHPFRLGRGERQKVALASVVVMEPEILLIDEPTTGQDRRGAEEIVRILLQLNAEGITILMVTHAMHLVAEYARRVIVFSDGQMLMDGPPRDVFSRVDALEKAHIRPPQVTQLGIKLGLERVPLTVEEARETIAEAKH